MKTLLFSAAAALVALSAPATADILVSSSESHSIEHFGNDGTWLGTFATTGPRVPYGLSASPVSGDVYVATFTGTILRYKSNGQPAANWDTLAVPPDGNPVESVLFDKAGNLWAATYFGESGYVAKIYKYAAANLSQANPQPSDTILTGLRRGNQMAFDQKGNICIASYFGADVRCFDPNNQHAQMFNYHDELIAAGIYGPGGFAFDGANRLYVDAVQTGLVGKELAPHQGPITQLVKGLGGNDVLFLTLDSQSLYVPYFHNADPRADGCLLGSGAAAYACNDYDFTTDAVFKVNPDTGAAVKLIASHLWGPYQMIFVDPCGPLQDEITNLTSQIAALQEVLDAPFPPLTKQQRAQAEALLAQYQAELHQVQAALSACRVAQGA